MKTKLCVFDFDQTLFDTPSPEIGKPIYEQKTGKPWPHRGWWGKIESMDPNIFDFGIKQDIVDIYNQNLENENNILMIMTGRMKHFEQIIAQVLDNHKINYQHLILKPYQMDTYFYKTKHIQNFLSKNPNIIELEMRDDRLEHIEKFEVWGQNLVKQGKLKTFKINQVF